MGTDPHADAFADISDERLVEAANRPAGIDLQSETHSDPLIGLSPFSLVLDTQPAESVSVGLGADVDAAAARAHPNPAQLVETYRKARPEASFGELRSAIMGDAALGAGSWALASAHAAHPQSAPFGHEFAWRSRPQRRARRHPTRWSSPSSSTSRS